MTWNGVKVKIKTEIEVEIEIEFNIRRWNSPPFEEWRKIFDFLTRWLKMNSHFVIPEESKQLIIKKLLRFLWNDKLHE